MLIKYTLAILTIIFSVLNLSGQEETIQTDRPDQTETPFIVPVSYLQVESGFLYEKVSSGMMNYFYPSSLWKYGLTKNLELRLITELITEESENTFNTGIKPITIGFKINLTEEKGLLPATSFIGHLRSSNVGSQYFHTDFYAPSFKFAMQHTLSEKISLGYNLGADWDGFSPEPVFIYSLATGSTLLGNLGGYIEIYGFLPQNSKSNHRMDGGLTYLINKDILADISAGYGLTDAAPNFYVGLGFSFRVKVN